MRSVQRVQVLEIKNNGFGDTLTTTCAAPVYRSNDLSSDTVEMTKTHYPSVISSK